MVFEVCRNQFALKTCVVPKATTCSTLILLITPVLVVQTVHVGRKRGR